MALTKEAGVSPQGIHAFHKRLANSAVDIAAGSKVAALLAKKIVPVLLERSTVELTEFFGMEHLAELKPYLEQGYNFRLMLPHESQADAGPMIVLADAVRVKYPDKIKKYLLPVAETMEGGQQGSPLEALYTNGVEQTLQRHEIYPDGIISDNDIKSRGMQKTSDTIGIRTALAFKRPTIGILMFPEAIMEGGRFKPGTVEMNGLQDPAESASEAIDFDLELNENIVYLVASIHGGYEVFSPQTKFFTARGIEMITNPMLYRLGNIQMQEKPIVVHVNKPFTSHDIRSSGKPGAQFIMEKIAEVHPRNAQGKFRR